MRYVLCRFLALALATSMPAVASAKDNPDAVPLTTPPSELRTDAAYLLVRVSHVKVGIFTIQHALLRVPSEQEMADYHTAKMAAYNQALPSLTKSAKDGKVPDIDAVPFNYKGRPDIFALDPGKFLEDGDLRTILVQVPAGKYILYGISHGGLGFETCNCLGTVSFIAKPGVITNVGSLFADKVAKPSVLPHLESGLGEQFGNYGFYFGQALVPPSPTDPIPPGLKALQIEPAKFEIVGEYYEPGATSINRLAPIPGLLSYVHGRPHDDRAAN